MPKRKEPDTESELQPRTTRSSTHGKSSIGVQPQQPEKPSTKACRATVNGSGAAKLLVNPSPAVNDQREDTKQAKPTKKSAKASAPSNAKKANVTKRAKVFYPAVSGVLTHEVVLGTYQTRVELEVPRTETQAEEKDNDDDDDVGTTVASVRSSKAIQRPLSTPKRPEAYSTSRALLVFDEYADESGVIGPEGLERLCADAGISMEGVLPLILAWQLNAQELAQFTKDQWIKGMDELKIDNLLTLSTALSDLQSLLVQNKSAAQNSLPATPRTSKLSLSSRASSSYNNQRLLSYKADVAGAFLHFYNFCFALAKTEQSRNIEIGIATAFWSVLLEPKYPIMKDILDYIKEKGSYKAVNKDLWSMTYEFCQTVSPSLEGYDSEGAWPTLLDEFVSWKRETTQPKVKPPENEDIFPDNSEPL